MGHKTEQITDSRKGRLAGVYDGYTLVKDITISEVPNILGRLPKAAEEKIYDESGLQLEAFKGIRNLQTDKVTQVYSDTYWLVQHEDVMSAVSDICIELGLKGKVDVRVSPYGDRMVSTFLFDQHLVPDDADGIQYGIAVENSFDASCPIRISSYGLRLVCSNGMMARSAFTRTARMHSVARGKTVDLRPELMSMVRDALNGEKVFRDIVEKAMQESFAWETIQQLIAQMLDKDVAFKHLEKIFKDIGVTIMKVKDEKTKKWKVSIIQESNFNPSRWALYNAFTRHLTHDETVGYALREHLNRVSERILTGPIEVTQ